MLTPAEYEKHYVKRRLFDGADWRLKRAVNRHRNRSKEIPSDPHIHLLLTYLQINDGNLDSESVLPDDYAEKVIKLEEAIEIWKHPVDRIIVELMILAKFSNQEVSDETGRSLASIECFEDCFFDVRDMLTAKDAIVPAAIEKPYGAMGRPLRTEMLALAYNGGRIVAQACIDYLRHLGEPFDQSTEQGINRMKIDNMVKARIASERGAYGANALMAIERSMQKSSQSEFQSIPSLIKLHWRSVKHELDIPSSEPSLQTNQTEQPPAQRRRTRRA